MKDRQDFISDSGHAAWWAKDGAWHIAIREKWRGDDFFWTAEAFLTRDEAVAAIAKATA